MTYEQLQLPGLEKTESTPKALPSLVRGFRANRTLLLERVRAMVTSVTCGAKLQDVSESLSRSGSSARIRPVCLPELIKDTSSEYLPTLPKWGIACRGEYGELATSARLTSESGCLSVPIGTPTASMTKRSPKFMRKTLQPAEFVERFPTPLASQRGDCPSERRRHTPCLESYVKMVPTPTVCGNYNRKGASKTSGDGLATVVGGKLNPTWVAWLMGFPLEWTDLDV